MPNFTFQDGILNVTHEMSQEDSQAVLDFIAYIQKEQTLMIMEMINADAGNDEYRKDLIDRLDKLDERVQ